MKKTDKITEKRINDLLRKGLKAYLAFKKAGETEKANLILSVTSKLANLDLDLAHIRNHYYQPTCTCGRKITSGAELEFFNHVLICLSCDHLMELRDNPEGRFDENDEGSGEVILAG